MKMTREWAMPSPQTFSIKPIGRFVEAWVDGVIVDPFAASCSAATHTNDLNPDSTAAHHLEAAEFCAMLVEQGVIADVVLFDPPYSPRQMVEVYKSVGLDRGAEAGQNARLYKEVRDQLDLLLRPGGVALSFGWNSAGFGKGRGYTIEEIMIVAHGGAHNDTICVAERKQ